ncbi:alpha/beta hydrolase [Psychroflexus sp. ALD_RP9]|uniref:alpha/beta hydrolase n=1 Tax=Psychroflexus sp. ALD_RP9 TaxID=2777186 RepID=UPI001A8F5F9E|nr:esterase [Psychroflexus sp. ALD_RP9]QSS97432.1 esterase [Psychroflexus sp. ALD_RP9]
MAIYENKVSYTSTNTYSTFNNLTPQTEQVWIACHGIGYLSKYFIRYFNKLPKQHYIIAPQAPAKYYQTKDFKYVGASWLTKEQTALEIENVLNYLDAVWQNEKLKDLPINLMGYSQGVSVVMRWLAKREILCSNLIIHSGSIPDEFESDVFKDKVNSEVHLIYGNQDEYITGEKLKAQLKLAEKLFGNQLNVNEFDGKHEVNQNLLKSLAEGFKTI